MNFNKLKKWTSGVAVACGLALSAASAQSAVLYSFEDDDLDFVYRGGSVITSGPIAVGDVFVSVLEIPIFTIGGVNGIPAGQELVGVAAVQIQAIFCPITGLPGSCPGGGIGTQFVFGPPAAGLNSILALGGGGVVVPGGAAGQGATVSMFFNGTSGAGGDRDLDLNRSVDPASNCVSMADCIDQGSRGSLFQVDGFTGDPDEFWVSTILAPGGVDIGAVAGANNNLLVSAANIALGNYFNALTPVEYINIATGQPCGTPGPIADGCVQISISATITGGQGLSNGAFAHSDFDGQKFAAPEPGSLALLGLGLAGLGFGASRRKKAAVQ